MFKPKPLVLQIPTFNSHHGDPALWNGILDAVKQHEAACVLIESGHLGSLVSNINMRLEIRRRSSQDATLKYTLLALRLKV